MAGSIADFKSSFSNDLARPNKFSVEVPIPFALISYLNTSRNLSFRCEATELPGRAISTTSQKIYGPEEKYPYLTNYNDITLSFILSDDMKEKLFFDAWLEWVNPSFTHNFKYKGDYCTPIRINQHGLNNQVTYSIDLVDAFPIGISPMNVSWSADGYHVLPVTFAYTKWKDNSLQALGMRLFQQGIANYIDQSGGLNGNASTSGIGATGVENIATVRDAVAAVAGTPGVTTYPVRTATTLGADLPPL